MGQVITFYSYKGGVGRSMTVANVAVLLARWGKRVLIVDWDLEAPGIENFFQDFIDVDSAIDHKGLIDLLHGAANRGPQFSFDSTRQFLLPIPLPDCDGSLYLIPSGARTPGYFERVRSLDIDTFYQQQKGGDVIESLRDVWLGHFDYILVDSRTGITDIGGICTIQIPDILVLIFTATHQSLNGIMDVAAKAAVQRQKLPFDRLKLGCVPIPGRFDTITEHEESQGWLDRFAGTLAPLYADWLPRSIDRREFLEFTKIPYVPFFSFGEKLPVVDPGTSDPTSLGFAYENLAAILGNELEDTELLLNDRDRFVRQIRLRGHLRMSREEAFAEMERRIEAARHSLSATLDLSLLGLESIPESVGHLTQLQSLSFCNNELTTLPVSLGLLKLLQSLDVSHNKLTSLPESLAQLTQLRSLNLDSNVLSSLPSWLSQLPVLVELRASNNPLNPEVAAACSEGVSGLNKYFRAKADEQVALNEAKLIILGEGEVGKSSLLGALRGDHWEENRPTTHGIEIKPVRVKDPNTGTEILLNGWDFGGQRVYRPTHQLFFTSPAVYLVVWKPREGSQHGFVKEWIKLVMHREPDAKILVVATHGGPKERQPDIDRQEIWDLFGSHTVIDFFHVDSQPQNLDETTGKRTGEGRGIRELKDAITKVAAALPEMGRTFPKNWQKAREALRKMPDAYLSLERVFAIFKEHKIEEEDARLLLRICHRVGDLIHYEHDRLLRDIVVLKPDWLATAISFVLDDKETREVGHGLVKLNRLETLWNDPERPEENRYPAALHPLFLRLMERFDLSYRIAEHGGANGTSLIAQLVPDVRPEGALARVWPATPSPGDEQQVQICRIVETTSSQSATAEGLFPQLIVRLHKYSLGRANFSDSVHWQRGLVLEDDTGAHAFLEHIGNDVRITVRSPYPARFLTALTYETKWLVEDFWKGMRCEVTVPCLVPQANREQCKGLFEVGKLIENKKRGRPEQPCSVCNEWQSIEQLLGNATAAQPNPLEELVANFTDVKGTLEAVRAQLVTQHAEVIGRYNQVDAASKETVSKVESAYSGLMHTLLDEAKEGPRLFSFEPVEPGFLDRPKWLSAMFKLTLWCEHSRMPLWLVSGDPKIGVYRIDLPREWLVNAAPFLKVLSSTLGLTLPVVAAGAKVVLPETDYKEIEAELARGKSAAENLLKGGEKVGDGEWLAKDDDLELSHGAAIRADGAILRQLHAWLKEKDPSFGGLVRVQNKRQEFLWVHPNFETEY